MHFSNTNVKKLMSLLLAVLMIVGLFAGCKKDKAPETTEEPQAAPSLNLEEPTEDI